MKLQFLLCENPLKQEQGTYIYHVGFPRFLAKAESDKRLTLIDCIDGDPEKVNYMGKLKRARDWYIQTLKRNHAHPG